MVSNSFSVRNYTCKQLNHFVVDTRGRTYKSVQVQQAMNHGTVWSDKEVRALIAIWGDSTIQEDLDGAVRNKVIFQKIAKKLQEQGIQRDWVQCRAKIKNLKTKYRASKNHNGITGNGRKTCKFYSQLDRILGHRPASVPSALLDSGEFNSESEEEETDGNYYTRENINEMYL